MTSNAMVKANNKPARTKSGAAVRLMGGTIDANNAREWKRDLMAAANRLWDATGPSAGAASKAALAFEDAALHCMCGEYGKAQRKVASGLAALNKSKGPIQLMEPCEDDDDDE